MHQYQPTWHNFRDGVQNAMKLREQQRQHDVAQALKQEELATDKAQFQQNLTETQRQFDAGLDVTKEELRLKGEEFKLNKRSQDMVYDNAVVQKKIRTAQRGVATDTAHFLKQAGEKESQYQNVLEDQPWYEKAYRAAYNKGDYNPLVAVNAMLGLFGAGVESREESAARQTGYDSFDKYQPNLMEKYGEYAPSAAFEATQRYFPSQFGSQAEIDLGMQNSPLMLGGYNQFGGGQ